MSDQGNIFLTWENLAFSLPLLAVVGGYLFFKYVPLWVAAVLCAVGFGAVQVRNAIAARKEHKLQTLDESTIRDLIGDDGDGGGDTHPAADQSKARRAKAIKVQQRLAQERKAENRSKSKGKDSAKGGGDPDDDVDEDDLLKFAKGSRQTAAAAKSKKP